MQKEKIGPNLILETATPFNVLRGYNEAQRSRIYSRTHEGIVKLARERILVEKVAGINLKEILRKHGGKASYVLVEKSDSRPELFINGRKVKPIRIHLP